MKNIKTLKVFWLVLCIFLSSMRISAQDPDAERQRREVGRAYEMDQYYKKQRQEQEQNYTNNDSGLGWLLLGGIFVAGILASQANSTSSTSSEPIQRSTNTRIVKAPVFILSSSTPIFKTNINEHFTRLASINYDAKGELLLIGKKAESANFGLYASGAYSDNKYKLPYEERRYALGYEYIKDGVEGEFYRINQEKDFTDGYEYNSKFIQLRETSWNAGLSFKTFFEKGFLVELESGIRFQRNVSLRFKERYPYLPQGHQLKQLEFSDVATTDGKPLFLNIPNGYMEAGVGFFGKSSVYLKISGRLSNIDYQKTESFSVFWENDLGEFKPVKLDQRMAYHIQVAMGFML